MCKTIKQKVRFKTEPKEIYKAFADSATRGKFTGKKAVISKSIGGKFSAEGGSVSGLNVDLKAHKRIVQAWRNRKFPEGIFSLAAITLEPTKTGTELILTHRGVPKALIPEVEKYWRDFYSRIRASISRASKPRRM